MARETIVRIIDDLDGTVIEDDNGESIEFSYRGKSYTIDLTDENAAKFDKAMKPYLEAATQTRATRQATRASRSGGKEDLAAIREWAREHGYKVAERGRVSAEIREAYAAAKAA